MLRSSAELFACYDEYYQLCYPQGGSTLPSVVMTESSLTLLAKNSLVDEAESIGSTPLPGTSSADSGLGEPSEPSDLDLMALMAHPNHCQQSLYLAMV